MEKVTSREQVKRGFQYYLAVKEGENIRSFSGRSIERRPAELVEVWIKAGLLWVEEPKEELVHMDYPETHYTNR